VNQPQTDRQHIRLRTWRTWLGAIAVAVVVAALAQLILHRVFMELGMLGLHVVSGAFHAAIIAIPVILFLAWRTQARALKLLYQRLQSAESLRDDLVNMLVHDLKNPVISAGLAVESMARDREQGRGDCEHEEEMLNIARESLKRTEVMIGDILTSARADAGKLDPDFQDIDLAAIVRKQVEQALPRVEEKDIDLETDIETEEIRVRADVRMMRRVIDNLLENAIKHTPKKGRISIKALVEAGSANVSVRDSGRGIPEALRDKIFDKFGQAELRQKEGLSVGLGLTVCKLIVEAHGGRIWVESADDQGSDFRFTIPLRSEKATIHDAAQ
jgi:two-component system, sensor histidine kinase and response regulator